MTARVGGRSERPSAIRTFLIADIRGYTRFTDQFGDEAASRLATTFAQIVAEGMEAWGGQLVELRGDEALCTFESPRASLRCALELQQTFAEEAASAPDLPLRVGMGLDVGEAVPVGDGYRGAALNLAARLCAGAEAGEIRATQNLAHVAGPIAGIEFEQQGSERLKGVSADVAVVRVRLTAEHATTPRAGAVRPGGRSPEPLPAELESVVPFVGRSGDLLWLRWYWRRARSGHGRVVEVVGPDGIGKTRLVSELARLAHAEGAVVRLHSGGTAGSDGSRFARPTVVVLDDADRSPSRVTATIDELEERLDGLPGLVILTRSEDGGAAPPHRPRRLLEPMTEGDVAEVATLYASDSLDPPPVRLILDESGGVPRAVHRIASQWARTAVMRQMGESARRTSRERRGLREAESELIGHYADLEMTRERTRMYASGDETGDAPASAAEGNVCPYKGLAAYEAADADYYFGREQLVGELVARVVGSSFVGLVGASGSGKSSALSAGLLPALANGVLPGSGHWIQVVMRPGIQPMRRLADALERSHPAQVDAEADPEVLVDRVIGHLSPAQRLLVVIDQFEEVFTADEDERERFIDLIAEGRPAMKVVLAVRADQYERCASYPRLARQLAADQVLVGPVRSEEVAAIARHPAERVGLRVEPELVEALIADLGTEPGAMPLLSTALLELWEGREEGKLTLAAYRATGGVRGAVARLAESAYIRLDPAEHDAARSVFMRLVGEGSEPETIVRRRLAIAELETMGDPRMSAVVDKLTTGRLLTRDEGTVEIAHEALIREWPRLREWIEADAEGRQVRLHLIEVARAWNAGGREEGDLYRGARLAAALEWATEHEAELNAVEGDFLETSRATAEHAAERQRHANRILRGLLAGAGVLLVVAAGAGAIAWVQAGQNAENASIAQERELSLSALTLTPEDPELGLLLAAEAVELSRVAGRTPQPQALQALWTAYVAGKSITAVPGVGSRAVAYSPDGTELAVDAPELPDALVTIRDPFTGEQIDAVPRAEEVGEVEAIAYSPDGRWLAVATTGPPGAGQGSVSVFDTSSLERSHRLASGHDGYRGVTVTDAGLLAASGTRGNQREVEIVAWDLASGGERAIIGTVPGLSGNSSDIRYLTPLSVAMDPVDGQLIVGSVFDAEYQNAQGFVSAINLPEEVLRCPWCPDARPAWMKALDLIPDLIAPSPDGSRIAVGDIGRGRIAVIDPLLGVPVFEPVTYRNPRWMEWSADGTRLAVSGGETAVVLDAADGSVLVTLPSRGETILAASIRAGSDEISAVSSGGGLRIHRTIPTGGDLTTAGGQPVDLGVTADHVVLSLADVGIAVYDRGSGTELHGRDFEVEARLHAHVAKDAGHVAGMYENGSAAVIEAATLRGAARLPGCAAPAGTSPDGRYVVLDRSFGRPGVCAEGEAPAGVFDVAGENLVIEYGSEHLAHGAISNPAGSDGPRYAAVAVYPDVSGPGRLDIWDLDSATLLASIGEESRPGFLPTFVSFSSDVRYLAIGTDGPRAIVLDVAALAEGADLADAIVFDREVHTSRAPKAVVTDDGVLGTSSGDGVYRFWSLETGDMTMQLEVTGILGNGVFDFSPDFEFFYYEDGGGVIRRMPVDVDAMTDLATASLTRALTDDECRQYLHTEGCGAR